jgi:hypothetical protein
VDRLVGIELGHVRLLSALPDDLGGKGSVRSDGSGSPMTVRPLFTITPDPVPGSRRNGDTGEGYELVERECITRIV